MSSFFNRFPSSIGEGLGYVLPESRMEFSLYPELHQDPYLKMVKAIIDFLQHHVVMVPWSPWKCRENLGHVEVKVSKKNRQRVTWRIIPLSSHLW